MFNSYVEQPLLTFMGYDNHTYNSHGYLADLLVEGFLWLLGGVEVDHFVGEQPAVAVVDASLDHSIPRGNGQERREGGGRVRGRDGGGKKKREEVQGLGAMK